MTGYSRSNSETLFGMNKVLGDSQLRTVLDPTGLALFYPLFADVVAEVKQCGGLDAMRVLDGRVLRVSLLGHNQLTKPPRGATKTIPYISKPS